LRSQHAYWAGGDLHLQNKKFALCLSTARDDLRRAQMMIFDKKNIDKMIENEEREREQDLEIDSRV